MILLSIGVLILALYLIFRKYIKLVFRIIFYIGAIITLILVVSTFNRNVKGQGMVINNISNGVATTANSNIVKNLQDDLVSGVENETENIITLVKNKSGNIISNFINNPLEIADIFSSNKSSIPNKLTLSEYKNSPIYNEQIFKTGDDYVYINGILSVKNGGATNDYNIYEANVNGYNYKPVESSDNNFSGFEIDSNSITIDGVTYYKNLVYNKITVYGQSYGTTENQLEYLKENKIRYKNGEDIVYINGAEYELGNDFDSIVINGKKYGLVSGNNNKFNNYININGFIYWISKEKNATSIEINGVNYVSTNNNILESLI